MAEAARRRRDHERPLAMAYQLPSFDSGRSFSVAPGRSRPGTGPAGDAGGESPAMPSARTPSAAEKSRQRQWSGPRTFAGRSIAPGSSHLHSRIPFDDAPSADAAQTIAVGDATQSRPRQPPQKGREAVQICGTLLLTQARAALEIRMEDAVRTATYTQWMRPLQEA